MYNAEQILDRTAEILMVEGYIKEMYVATPAEAEMHEIPLEPGTAPGTKCGRAHCFIGGLEAASNAKGEMGHWHLHGHSDAFFEDERTRESSARPALAKAYRALNEAAAKHTKRRKEGMPVKEYGPAEAYAEHPNTTRADLIKLLEKAKQYL